MKHHPITHHDGTTDKRYSVEREFCGHPEPRWVARFCGEWIGQSISRASASLRCAGHQAVRNGAEVVTEKRA